MLRVEGLSKRFGGFTAVDNVDFALEKGEILGLIGPNGSGKSTIFNMLSGTLKPNEGSIRLDGKEIAGTPPHAICVMGVGRTFQIPRPIRRLSILENAALAGFYGQAGAVTRAEAWRSAEEALELVGLPTDAAASCSVPACVRKRSPASPLASSSHCSRAPRPTACRAGCLRGFLGAAARPAHSDAAVGSMRP
mgnify:CR=1 FL=1